MNLLFVFLGAAFGADGSVGVVCLPLSSLPLTTLLPQQLHFRRTFIPVVELAEVGGVLLLLGAAGRLLLGGVVEGGVLLAFLLLVVSAEGVAPFLYIVVGLLSEVLILILQVADFIFYLRGCPDVLDVCFFDHAVVSCLREVLLSNHPAV